MTTSAAVDMRERVCLITGASAGIGRATALGLATLGANVVMVCRDLERGRAARAEILQRSGIAAVDLLIADLASQAAVRELARTVTARYPQLHVLVNNAAVNRSRRSLTPDGLETTFAVNHLAPFLLTNLLLNTLKRSVPARVVNVLGHEERLDLDDLMLERRYDPRHAYPRSKRAHALFTLELARRLEGSGVAVNGVNPGFARTNLGRDARGLFRLFLRLARPFMAAPERAAQALVYVASAPELEGVNGQAFEGGKQRSLPASAQEATAARQLWEISERLTDTHTLAHAAPRSVES